MNRNDRPGSRRYQRFHQVEIEIPGHVLGINRDRQGAVVEDPQSRRDIGAGADQDFVTRPDARRIDCEVERGSSAGHGNAVLASAISRETLLEAIEIAPEISGNLASPQRIGYVGDLRFTDRGFKNGYHYFTSISTLSRSAPRNGPCLTLTHCMASRIRIE